MKRIVLFQVVFIMFHFYSNAQKFQLGIQGGLTIANYEATGDSGDQSSDPRAGFTLGALARIRIKRQLIFQPEINWVQKGTRDQQTTTYGLEKLTLTTNHIEIPLNILYASRKGFFVGGGPSFSFAVSGRLKDRYGDNEENKKVHYGSKPDDIMKGFDFGGNLLVGYKFKNNILISGNGNMGISNLSNNKPETKTLTSYYFGLKLGYMFRYKKNP